MTRVPFVVRRGAEPVLKGEFGRNSCDTYQISWCAGVATWNMRLPAGQYQITTALERVCKNRERQDNGYLALYETRPPLAAAPAPAPPVAPPKPAFAPPAAALPLPTKDQPGATIPPGGGFAIGDFSQRVGPFGSDEDEVGDFAAVFATTRGIVRRRPSGAVYAAGTAPPGDVDVALFGLSRDGPVEITLWQCARGGRVRLYDLAGNLLGQSGYVHSGQRGLSGSVKLAGLARGVYALVVDCLEAGTECKDGNRWVTDVSGNTVDPISFVGPFETVPDHSVREDLNVDDLIGDLQALIASR